jgi:dUTPase
MDPHFTNDTTTLVYNHSDTDYYIKKGDKFCQIIIVPLPTVELVEVQSVQELEEAFAHGRGSKCWGSSGK